MRRLIILPLAIAMIAISLFGCKDNTANPPLNETTQAIQTQEPISTATKQPETSAALTTQTPQPTPRNTPFIISEGTQVFLGEEALAPILPLFEKYLEEHPGAIDIWIGGHTHTHPDDTYGGKSHIETKWGTHFVNAACLSRYHGQTNVPKSRLLTFCDGSAHLRVQCYMHTSEFLPQGWYDKAEQNLELSRPFLKK